MTALLSLCLLCLVNWTPQGEPAPLYSQTYAVFIRGKPSGTETVIERVDKEGNRVCQSQHELVVTDGIESKRLAFETTTIFGRGTATLVKYSYRLLSGVSKDYYEVSIKDDKITRVLSRSGSITETSSVLQPGTVILDFNVYHQYDQLARLYDFKKRGRQVFNDYIPVVGSQIPLAITWLEDSKLDYGKGTIPVRNFKIEFGGLRAGNYATDLNGRLVRVIIRDQDLEVVRQDLVTEK